MNEQTSIGCYRRGNGQVICYTCAQHATDHGERVVSIVNINPERVCPCGVKIEASSKLPAMSNGELYKYSSVGSYPLFYLDNKDNVLCQGCAQENLCSDFEDDRPVNCGVNWEDANLYCDQCSERIESAYAEEEENTEED